MQTRRGRRPIFDCAGRCGAALIALCIAAGCDGEPEREHEDAGQQQDAGTPPVFPADFERRYREMRDCRFSHEHELRYVRTLVSDEAREPYTVLSPDVPYPVGATLVKVEYDDEQCAEPIEYTALHKLEPGASPLGNDWLWQRVSVTREVLDSGAPWTCINCHAHHCAPPYGYDLTCAEEASEL